MFFLLLLFSDHLRQAAGGHPKDCLLSDLSKSYPVLIKSTHNAYWHNILAKFDNQLGSPRNERVIAL